MQPDYQEKLATLRGRIRTFLAFQGLVYIIGSVLVLVLVDMGLDRLLRLDVGQRVLLDLVVIGALGFVAYRHFLSPLAIPLSDERVAILIEHRFPELGDRLISALQFQRMIDAGKPISPALADQVMQQAAEQTARLPINELINTKRLGVIALIFGAFVLLGSGAGIIIPSDAWATWAKRNLLFQAEEWPYDSKVRILGFEDYKARVPSGEAFVLHIEALRERPDGSRYIIPKTVQISFRFGQGDWQTVEPNSKANEEGTYRYPLGAVFRPVEITVRAGDYKSPIHRIFIARRPELPNPVLSIVPPKYTRQKNTASRRTRAAAGSVPVPVGSKVTLTGEASKDLSRVLIYRNGKSVSGVKLTGPRTFEIAMATNDPKSSGTCKVILRDTEGVTNHSAALFSLLIEPDHRPVVRAKPVGIGDRITGVARVPFEIEVRDKYGLSEVGIRYELHRRKKAGGSRPATVHGYIRLWRAAAAPGSKQFSRERRNLDLEDEFEKKRQVDTEFQRAEAGDRLRVWIEATDYGVGERLTRFPEQGFHFSIVPQTVLHKHLLDQQKRLRRQYSTLVEREKGISWGLIRQRNMTEWKITKDNQMILDKLGTEQRRILRASLRLATAIEQIREQMENNRLDRKGDMRKKLRYKVISPMKDLADNQMTPFAADLERMAQQLGQKPVKQLDEAIDEAGKIVTRMQKILLAMERSEVFDEVVTRLRSIIRLQQELRRLTAEAHRKKVEGSLPDIFGQPTKEEKERKPSKPKKNKKNK